MRTDPTFTISEIILSKTAVWNDTFGQSYFLEVMRDVGWVLGLGDSSELPAANEPVFPNDQDGLHGQLLERPDSNDIDMYRFDIEKVYQDRYREDRSATTEKAQN